MDQEQLLRKFAAGITTPEDHQQFNEWFYSLSSDAQQQVLLQYEALLQEQAHFDPVSPSLTEHIRQLVQAHEQRQHRRTRIIRLRRFVAAAAAVVLLVMAGWWLTTGVQQDTVPMAQTPLMHDALPASNGAVLTLADGTRIVLDSAANGVIAQQGAVAVSKEAGMITYNGAATAPAAEVLTNLLSTPRGRQFQLVLPDGSKVWLNAASSIQYPVVFAADKRKVTITGEVYFEVATDPAKPFEVVFPASATTQAVVEVLGTNFNINCYSDEPYSTTSLLEGKVRLKAIHSSGEQAKDVLTMTPGQQMALMPAANGSDIKPVQLEPYIDPIAWMKGRFQFHETPFADIMRQVSRWYDVEVQYDIPVPQKKFTADLSRNTRLTEFLKVLELSGFQFTIEGKTLRVKA
jgi:transmembrane sensor